MQTGLARTLFFRREEHVPGAVYLTQNLGIEQTVIGCGVSALKIAGFWSREKGIDHD
jgi:hypothetical protein